MDFLQTGGAQSRVSIVSALEVTDVTAMTSQKEKCFNTSTQCAKSDFQIQIVMNDWTYQNYPVEFVNYHFFEINFANLNKIHPVFFEIQII